LPDHLVEGAPPGPAKVDIVVGDPGVALPGADVDQQAGWREPQPPARARAGQQPVGGRQIRVEDHHVGGHPLTGAVLTLAEAEAIAQSVLSSPLVTLHHTIALRAALGLMAVQRGDLLQCQEQYQALETNRGITVIGSTLTLTDRVLGLLSHTLGNLDTACEHFEEALIYCRKSGNLPELAWTCCEYAETLLQRHRSDDHTKATSLLDESLSLSQQLGMKPLMERVIGLQERTQSHPGRSSIHPKGLTERQVEVLQLIAQGKTNHEIAQELVLSERTVQRHIADIYLKIGARNRADATAFALGNLNSVK
jgi:ATP/maltotriose-dependent transcriptional regulator MalT